MIIALMAVRFPHREFFFFFYVSQSLCPWARFLLQGFTREFLKGGAGTSEDLLQEVRDAVQELSHGKKVLTTRATMKVALFA